MAWSEQTADYTVFCDTASARSGETVRLPLEIQKHISGHAVALLRPLLFRCDPAKEGHITDEDVPKDRDQLKKTTLEGTFTEVTTTGALSSTTAIFDIPADIDGSFQLLIEQSDEAGGIGQFVVVGVPAEHGIFTITR
jgi:hypothetical protein